MLTSDFCVRMIELFGVIADFGLYGQDLWDSNGEDLLDDVTWLEELACIYPYPKGIVVMKDKIAFSMTVLEN